MSKRTKTRMGHANPTSERNRRKERHNRHGWIRGISPSHAALLSAQPARYQKRRRWIDWRVAQEAKVSDGTI
jgi:hypothetical protein